MSNHVGFLTVFCVVMRCSDIDMGSYREIIFGLSFQCESPKSSSRHKSD